MDFLAHIFVAKPLHILAVAIFFMVIFILHKIRHKQQSTTRLFLITVIAWLLYALWEWLILIKTPDANIRVDLLMIWPILCILSLWTLLRFFRQMMQHNT
ncbi:MAG: hypothetical protein RR231_15200 [Acinetobacter sp.]